MNRIYKEKPKVFLVGGFPGSGKSSLTKMGNDVLNADVICVDDIHTQMLKDEFLWRNDSRIFDKAHDAAKESLSRGRNVMIDSVYMDEKSRQYTIDALEDVADVYMITVDTPIDVCKQRNANRTTPVEDWVYEKLWSEAKSPSLSEGFRGMYRFDNMTDLERQEHESGHFVSISGVITDAEKGRIIGEARDFLQSVADDVGIEASRQIPKKFEALSKLQQEDEDCGFGFDKYY